MPPPAQARQPQRHQPHRERGEPEQQRVPGGREAQEQSGSDDGGPAAPRRLAWGARRLARREREVSFTLGAQREANFTLGAWLTPR